HSTSNPERTEAILNAWESLQAVGRPVAAPPGTPAERVRFLREAFDQAMHDPELLAISEKTQRPFDYASGEEMKQIVATAFGMSDEMKGLLANAGGGELRARHEGRMKHGHLRSHVQRLPAGGEPGRIPVPFRRGADRDDHRYHPRPERPLRHGDDHSVPLLDGTGHRNRL